MRRIWRRRFYGAFDGQTLAGVLCMRAHQHIAGPLTNGGSAAIMYLIQKGTFQKEGLDMITLFIIGVLILAVKLILLTVRMAWGITKGVFFVLGIPIALILLFIAGLVYAAIPLLLFALAAVFLWPLRRG